MTRRLTQNELDECLGRSIIRPAQQRQRGRIRAITAGLLIGFAVGAWGEAMITAIVAVQMEARP